MLGFGPQPVRQSMRCGILVLAGTLVWLGRDDVGHPAARAGSAAQPAMQGRSTGELVERRQGSVVRPSSVAPTEERLRGLDLPDGFTIDFFARDLGKPRMLAVGDDGTVYVTRRDPGDVLALRDTDGDGRADERRTVVELPNAHGIALRDNTMYLATVQEVYALDLAGGETADGGPARPQRIIEGLPPGGRHPNRTLGFGPDGHLFITVGSTCNCCVDENPEAATILIADPATGKREIFATGLRNTIGFDWHPQTQELWGMDHGSDWLGDEVPPEELNRLQRGNHYGWPFLYGDNQIIQITDYPDFFDPQAWIARSAPPVLEYDAHAAPIQMTFYTGGQFPAEYRNDAFVAMHGSWNRRPPVGYEVVRIRFDEAGRPQAMESFITGFLLQPAEDDWAYFSRPAGIAVAQDGSLLVGDDANGAIYRVSYTGDAEDTAEGHATDGASTGRD